MVARDQIVSVERRAETPDGGGGGVSAWSSIGSLWVSARAVQAREDEVQGAKRGFSVQMFNVDTMDAHALSVSTGDRLNWDGRLFDITEVRDEGLRKNERVIVATTGRDY